MGIIATKGDGGREFEPCPEFMGRAVCVDVTPLKEYQTQYGPKQKFKLVFEIDLPDDSRKPPQPWIVMSAPMTPSLNEKAALAKLLTGWFGRKLTDLEAQTLDMDTLIGRPASIVIGHDDVDGKIYANIKALLPHKQGEPLKPSGKWVRLQDRPAKDGGGTGGSGSSYRRAPGGGGGAGDAETADPSKTKVHVGKNKGLELRELTEEAVRLLITLWMPGAKSAEKQSADDKRLIKALEWYQAEFEARALAAAGANGGAADDDIPF
jgi:hypothetical protein